MPKRDAHTHRHAKVPRETIVHKQATEKLHVLWFAQAKLLDSLLWLHIPGWCHLYMTKSYLAT